MCKHMRIRHAKTVAYHSRSNGRAEVAGRQMFEKFRQCNGTQHVRADRDHLVNARACICKAQCNAIQSLNY